ncbi:EpsG family protein [Serratia sp. IR-2025]
MNVKLNLFSNKKFLFNQSKNQYWREDIYHSTQRNGFIVLQLLLLAVSFFYLPYLTLVVMTGMAALLIAYLNSHRSIGIKAIFLITAYIISAVPLASKMLYPTDQNDKVQYFYEMTDSQSLSEWLNNYSGFDFISHFMLKFSSLIFGAGNSAFAFYYLVSFLILSFGLSKLNGRYFALVIFMFLCQYNFQGLYGNLLRQSLALSFLVVASGYIESRKKSFIFICLAAMTHFSFVIFLPMAFIKEKYRKVNTATVIIIASGIYFSGKFLLPVLLGIVGGNEFLVNRVDAYEDSTFGNDFTRKIIITVIFMTVVEIIYLLRHLAIFNASQYEEKRLVNIRFSFLFCALTFFLTTSLEEVANRYAFNMMIFVLSAFVFAISIIKSARLKSMAIFSFSCIAFSAYIYINTVGVQVFYYGDLNSILTDSLHVIWSKIEG